MKLITFFHFFCICVYLLLDGWLLCFTLQTLLLFSFRKMFSDVHRPTKEITVKWKKNSLERKRWHYKIRSEFVKESSIKGMSRQVLFVVTFSTHNTNDTFGRDFQTPTKMSNKRTVGEFQTFNLLFRYVILWEKVCRLRFKVNQMTKGKGDYCCGQKQCWGNSQSMSSEAFSHEHY